MESFWMMFCFACISPRSQVCDETCNARSEQGQSRCNGNPPEAWCSPPGSRTLWCPNPRGIPLFANHTTKGFRHIFPEAQIHLEMLERKHQIDTQIPLHQAVIYSIRSSCKLSTLLRQGIVRVQNSGFQRSKHQMWWDCHGFCSTIRFHSNHCSKNLCGTCHANCTTTVC